MPEMHASLLSLFDHVVGLSGRSLRRHMETCERCSARGAAARRVVAAGRRALAERGPSRRQMRTAMRAFRQAREHWASPILRLVLDSFLCAAPAVRTGTRAPQRFLRYEGEITVEMQIMPARKGITILGCVSPAASAEEVVATVGDARRHATIGEDGMFALRDIPRKELELTIGTATITGLCP